MNINKKLQSIILLFFTFNIFASANSQGLLEVSAEVVEQTSLNIDSTFNFGGFLPTKNSGTISLDVNGNQNCSGGVICHKNKGFNQGKVTVNGQKGRFYNMIIQNEVILTNETGDTMILMANSNNSSGNFDGSAKNIFFSGSINVNANQPPGIYTGTISIELNIS